MSRRVTRYCRHCHARFVTDCRNGYHQRFTAANLNAAKNAGISDEVTAHVFRRSCTSEPVKGNANLYHVSRLLGHESLDTLQHYVKLHVADLRETHRKTHPRERDEEERGN